MFVKNFRKNRVLTIIFCIEKEFNILTFSTNVLSPIRMIEAELYTQLPDVSEI